MKKSSTPEIRLNRKIETNKKRQEKFNKDMKKYEIQINEFINFKYADSEIIKRINDVSRFRIKKMIFLLKNNLNSNHYFQLPIPNNYGKIH